MGYYYDTDSSSSEDYYAPHCGACNRDFVSHRALSQHNAAMHCFECQYCTREFSSARARNQHSEAVHSYECDHCDLILPSENAAARHVAAEHAHVCNECNRSFRSANNLMQHTQTHRPRAIACPACGSMHHGRTDVALHFEAGGCPACPNRARARREMYQFVSASAAGRRNLTNAPMIGYGDYGNNGGYDEDGSNYVCTQCHREFHAMGSLLQHCDARPQCRGGGSNFRIEV